MLVWLLWEADSSLSIPVFFDTVFYLMIPLAKATRIRVGKTTSSISWPLSPEDPWLTR